MAWCTFSSDDYQCDLRLVSTLDGFLIMAAAERIIGDVPSTANLEADGLEDELNEAERRQIAFVRSAAREPIDLPHAGEEFRFDEYEDFVAKVRELVELGYRIPEEVSAELSIAAPRP
ncbi:hypothetical protein G6L37_00445 [Agrobacterium rubi]|nr:hypothetical protein [Agrobacterium rubi]NTF23858.1 hypothetical protein [Agrobacterium rubi]